MTTDRSGNGVRMSAEDAYEIARRALGLASAQQWHELSTPLAVEPMPWLERSFPTGLPIGLFPALLGRFEGNLQRITATLLSVDDTGRTTRPPTGAWSIQEHAGHLLDLERLGMARLREFERAESLLSPADMSNRATNEAGYNAQPVAELIDHLAAARWEMVERLHRLTRAQIEHAAVHPRLEQPMNVVDWVFFMCEHDDHHLAHMRALARAYWRSLAESRQP